MSEEPNPGVAVSLTQLREILGDEYLAKRPSFDRAHARVKKRSGIDMNREDFDRLKAGLRNLEELLNEGKVDRSKFKVRKYTVNSWGQDGDHFQVKAHLVPIDDSPLAELRPAEKVNFNVKSRATGTSGMEILVLPDLHVGYKRAGNTLIPLHDESCLALYLKIAKHFRPPVVVLTGDALDLPAISKYLTPPDLKFLVQPSIDRLGAFLQELRATLPDSRLVYLAGNHEERVDTSLKTFLPELLGLARAGETEPVLGVPYLLRCKELGVEYVSPYGAHIYINGVRFHHGDVLGKRGGDSVSKMLDKYRRNVACGHIHRVELAFETIHTEEGVVTVFAMSVGTGAHLDGRIPGPMEPNWQQGLGAIWRGGFPSVHVIKHGKCFVGTTGFEVTP
jgi:hypothetical protein